MSELTYTNRNGYQIPNIVMDSRKNEPETLTRYGRAREKYLMEHRKAAYTAMLLKGTLWAHLTEIDQAANQQVESVMAELAMSEGVTEELKARDPMAWVGLMNTCKAQAGTGKTPGGRVVDLGEGFKQPRLIRVGDPDPGVGDRDQQLLILPTQVQCHLPLFGKFEGVVQ